MTDLDLIELVLLVVFFGLPLAGIIDAARIPAEAWRKAGRSKRFWILVQVLGLYLGSIIYLAGVRNEIQFFNAPPAPDWDDVQNQS